MAVVKVENKTYTVDPLYQWDKNQALEIRGLSLAKVPEIHFTTKAMDRAIVRQASMDAAGILTVDVPNSLLQKPYTIQVFVCTYEGSTFQTLYKLEVPVKGRPMPTDYTLEDDPEVYSFNALENKIENTVGGARDSYQAAAAAMNTAASELTTAKSELTEAKKDEKQAEATFLTAAQALTNAQTAYNNARETLEGVEDGSVFLKKAGDEMAGDLNMGGHSVTGLADPVNDGDAVNLGFISKNVLWENSDPNNTNGFNGQKVLVDLSGFSLVYVLYGATYSSGSERTGALFYNLNDRNVSQYMDFTFSDGTRYRRGLYMENSGITFMSCNKITGGVETANDELIPLIVYGIR